ncbi:kinesin motor domain-containing protein [Phakopsora pachyrhizi]|nr:kinesin motor domain-containing protein [Phakopsora pachyrhizi]
MCGYDATIFAYGQTASGKTFTLSGNRQQPGILPLSVQDIFSFIRSHPEREFLLRVSYLEIYNEQINDLLLPPDNLNPQPIKIRQTTSGYFFPEPLREELVTDLNQVQSLLNRGEANRHVAGTDFNSRSSRSHTIFGIIIESRLSNSSLGSSSDPIGSVNRSKVCIIDLAGNERATSEVERRCEGAFINKSLLTLEKVISALISTSSSPSNTKTLKLKKVSGKTHVPFRDSKLTQILQPSLLGDSKVCVICTINGSSKFLEESKSTIRFATRVKKVEVRASKKEILSERALLTRYQSQVECLYVVFSQLLNLFFFDCTRQV